MIRNFHHMEMWDAGGRGVMEQWPERRNIVGKKDRVMKACSNGQFSKKLGSIYENLSKFERFAFFSAFFQERILIMN